MRISELKNIKDAPLKGCVLAYTPTPKGIIFRKYDTIDSIMEISDELLEIHLFDSEKEYRAIVSDEKRFDGIIEHCADFKISENVIKEGHILENDFNNVAEKIMVLNLFVKEENGTVSLSDYRLAMEEAK